MKGQMQYSGQLAEKYVGTLHVRHQRNIACNSRAVMEGTFDWILA